MVFSSITFIYYFLPLLLIIYFITKNKYKNSVLLLFSLLFYFIGEGKFLFLLVLSSIVNFIFGLVIEKSKKKKWLVCSIVFNLGLLAFFKYTNFIISNVNIVVGSNLEMLDIILPIGISFFTFQTIGYVDDVYKGNVKASHNIIDFMTYVCLFPQLVAGPIVRYKDVNSELSMRKVSFNMFSDGVRRFIIGLGKKVLIANVMGEMCVTLSGLSEESVLAYILIGIGYTVQIYFDFSGYSDMAIGLGKMFGFNFLENFNYPLIAHSLTDFWRRWHISLSSFFRDYVYIPLGGNKVGKYKHIFNLFIVWFLTGLWHGANYNFIIWGLYFFIFLIIEKYIFKDYFDKHRIVGHIYTGILIIISFVIFSLDDMNQVLLFLKSMFGLNNLVFMNKEVLFYLRDYLVVLIISFIGITPIVKYIYDKYRGNIIFDIIDILFLMGILIISTAFLVDSTFNPFLYFRF